MADMSMVPAQATPVKTRHSPVRLVLVLITLGIIMASMVLTSTKRRRRAHE